MADISTAIQDVANKLNDAAASLEAEASILRGTALRLCNVPAQTAVVQSNQVLEAK